MDGEDFRDFMLSFLFLRYLSDNYETAAKKELSKTYADREAKLCAIIQKNAEGLAEVSTDLDALGDAYEYLIGQFAAGSGKKAGEFYTLQHGLIALDRTAEAAELRRRSDAMIVEDKDYYFRTVV